MNPSASMRNGDEIQEDTAILIQAAVQDISKFSDLYTLHYPAVYRFVFKRTCERELSFDLTSTVFLKAMENLKSYRYTGVPFEAWLYRIALNEIYSQHRKRKISLVYNLEMKDVIELAEEIESGDTDRRISQLLKILPQLDKEEMDLIEMRFFSRQSVRDIACVLNISENNVSVRLHRILKKINRLYHKHYSHDKL